MITKVNLRRIYQEKSMLHETIYTPKDITNELEMPILNHERLDDVLDTTQISLLNYESEPIKPFTRMIITLTDTVDEISTDYHIYRYVENDNVTNICMGSKPIYRHTLSLIEITKELERVDCSNLTFTNYLESNYGTDKEVQFYTNEIRLDGYKLDECEINYTSTSGRFYGPNKELGTTINTNILLDIKYNYCIEKNYNLGLIGFLKSRKRTANLNLIEFYVKEPNGTKTNLSINGTYTYEKNGTHIFHQIYKNSSGGYKFEIELIWYINVIEGNSLPQEYTIIEVLNRLINVCKLRRLGLDETKYKIDPNIIERLELNKLSPEFTFTEGTLFENLSLIGGYINAIPRLLPSIQEEIIDDDGNVIQSKDDYSNWNLISFDFLGEENEYSNDNYSIFDSSSSMSDFAGNFVSNVQNATESNYDGNTTVTEPFIGGAISTRTESANFEISNDEAVIKTRLPIRSIIKVTAKCSNLSVDITSRIKEKSSYDLLPAYTNNSKIYENKAFYLYYTKGTKNIYGLTYKRPQQTWLESFSNEIAIKNILNVEKSSTEIIPNFIKDLSFEIEYIPYMDFKFKQFKEYIDDESDVSNSLIYNQQANQVDIDAYGEYMKGVLLKTGNPEVSITNYFNNFSELPKLAQNLENYKCFSVDSEIYCFTPIKTTINWSKFYNKISEYNALKKNIREYEISENESENRNLNYQEFCIVDTKLDVGQLFDSQEDKSSSEGIKFTFTETSLTNQYNVIVSGKYFQKSFQITSDEILQSKESIIETLSKTGFGTSLMLNQVANKLANNLDYKYKPLSYAIVQTKNSNEEEIGTFLIPISCFASGNSIVLSFTTDDNYSAGTTSIDTSELEQEINPNDKDNNKIASFSYNLEDYISYSDKYGRFKSMFVAYGHNEPISDFDSNIIENSKELYKINSGNINGNDLVIDFSSNPFYVDKDSRENIALTSQLNFVTTNRNITIGKALSHTMPIIGDTKTQYAFVIFKKRPNRFSEYVDIDTYIFNEGYCTIGDIVLEDGSIIPGNQSVKCSGFLNPEVSEETKSIKISSTYALTDGVGYGIIDNNNRLVLYIDEPINKGDKTKSIYLMFRRKV